MSEKSFEERFLYDRLMKKTPRRARELLKEADAKIAELKSKLDYPHEEIEAMRKHIEELEAFIREQRVEAEGACEWVERRFPIDKAAYREELEKYDQILAATNPQSPWLPASSPPPDLRLCVCQFPNDYDLDCVGYYDGENWLDRGGEVIYPEAYFELPAPFQVVSACEICKKPLPDHEPEYCCSGSDCGCRGLPIDPPWCFDCFEKNRTKSTEIPLLKSAIEKKGKSK